MITTTAEAQDMFDESLDSEGPVKVAGLEFDRSRILKTVNPADYRSLLYDFVDGMGVDPDLLDEFDTPLREANGATRAKLEELADENGEDYGAPARDGDTTLNDWVEAGILA